MNSAAAATEPARPRSGRGLQLAPILRASHAQIRELRTRRGTSLTHMRAAVENDPAVALNLFAEVNADLKRAGHAPVGDIARAILFTGIAELPDRISRAGVLEDAVGPGLGEELIRMLCRAHHASRQARAIGALAGGLNGDELLAAALARESLPYLERLAAEPNSQLNLAAFSDFLPATPDSHDAQVTSTKCLDLAARFADATARAWDESALDGLYAEIEEFTGRSAHDVARSLRLATVEAARAGVHYPNYAPALRLMCPGKAPRSAAAVRPPPARVQPPATAAAADAAPVPPAAKKVAAARKVKKAPPTRPAAQQQTQSSLQRSLAKIEHSAASGDSAAVLLPLALQAICDGTDMGRALLLMRDKTSSGLRLRAHRGLEDAADFNDSTFALDGDALLEQLMARPAAFHWLREKHGHLLTHLPPALIGGNSAFLYSLHVNEKPLGVLIGCCPHTREAKPGAAFAAFKRIGAVTREGLQRSLEPARKRAAAVK